MSVSVATPSPDSGSTAEATLDRARSLLLSLQEDEGWWKA